MRSTANRRRSAAIGAFVGLALIAGACSNKKDGGDTTKAVDATEGPATTAGAAEATDAPEVQDTEAAVQTTDAAPATDATETTDAAPAAADEGTPTPGGTLIVSGEAEVANPWTPGKMQCDSYCQQRARTIFDPIAAIGEDLKPHPYLAESIEPNAEFTEWTIKVRPGIKFHDGTDVNADAFIKNMQASGTGLLIANSLVDVAKNPDKSLKIEKVDDMTLTIFTGKGGDPTKPLPWPGFDAYLTGQFGFVASPAWLDAAAADPALESQPVGSGPFVYESYAPRDKLVVTKNPNYWQKDANGVQLPYLDKIEFRVIEDSEIAGEALQNGDIDIFSTSSALVVNDFRGLADEFPMREQTDFVETNYYLIDLDKAGPLQDQRIRCAMAKAIDRQEIIDTLGAGLVEPANGLFSPGQEGYLEDNGFDMAQDMAAAQKMVAEYEAENGDAKIEYGTTVSQVNTDRAELLKGYWEEAGIDVTLTQIPQDKFITNALFGVPEFQVYGWRNHAGLYADQQYFWWHSSAGPPDGSLALNFGRVRDDIVDAGLEAARSDPDPAKRQAAAESVNKRMAEMCYQIPESRTLWGTPHKASVKGLGKFVFPDGTPSRDGAGFSGSFWVNALWIEQ